VRGGGSRRVCFARYSAPGAFGPLEEQGDDEEELLNMPRQAEHPSRTLFVRNLANDTDPLALQEEFEEFGPVRSIYANCKYRGFVMISFFDIRHAKAAMLVLNGKRVAGKVERERKSE
jgi:RNA recognition motif-containing protein